MSVCSKRISVIRKVSFIVKTTVVATPEEVEAILISWNRERLFGVLQGPKAIQDRYYLPFYEIMEEPPFEPKAGQRFRFTVSPPRWQGQMRRATNARLAGVQS